MVLALTVTYADRREYLKIVLSYIETCKYINEILVVGNGVSYNLEEFIRENGFSKARFIAYDENKGSAFGFAEGLKALERENDEAFVFVLDDDNLPIGNVLSDLIDAWDLLSREFEKDQLMLASLRKDRSYLANIVLGVPQRFCFPQPNAFLGFDLSRIFDILFWKLFGKLKHRERYSEELVKIPMAPYGGLFFNLKLLKKIGYPNEDYFVYADDFDFTYRLTKLKGAIFLVPKAEIDDLDKSWLNKTRQGFFQSRYLQQDDFRSYISVRNFTFFAKSSLVSKMSLFNINRKIYLLYLFFVSLFNNSFRQYKLIKSAVKDGMQGHLGTYKYNEDAHV